MTEALDGLELGLHEFETTNLLFKDTVVVLHGLKPVHKFLLSHPVLRIQLVALVEERQHRY